MFRGSCLCGNVRYELHISEEVATKTSLCHCRVCRKITSAATSVNLAIPFPAFELTSGTLKTVTSRHMDEGFEFATAFCEGCGSIIYASTPPGPAPPATLFIQAGTLDDALPLEVTPEKELNVKWRPRWVGEVQGAGQHRAYDFQS